MGRKVNPIGARLGFNKNWVSHWFSERNYAESLHEDAIIRQIVTKRHARAGIASITIFRNRGDRAVTVHTAKPGLVIGRSGAGIQELRRLLELALTKHHKGLIPGSLRLNVVEVKNPELDAKLVGENIAGQIERRIAVKRAMRLAVERTMEKKAKGIKIQVSGRIGGAEIARSEKISQGSTPLQTLKSDISYASVEAKTTFGIIGVKVWIYLGESTEMPEPIQAEQQLTRNSRDSRGEGRDSRDRGGRNA